MQSFMSGGSVSASTAPVEPIHFIDFANDTMELTLDGILALQNNSHKKIESMAFITNPQINEQDFIKSIVQKYAELTPQRLQD